ncbi:hypothetical protein CN918_27080 [Priestia megaterium]|nr:hypothetical protein CN918_27080 [Priestia megaterium]
MNIAVVDFVSSHLYLSIGVGAGVFILLFTLLLTTLPKSRRRKKVKRVRKQMKRHAVSSSQQLLDQLFDTQNENWLSTSNNMSISPLPSYKKEAIVFFPFPTKTYTHFVFTEKATKDAPSWNLTLYERRTKLLSVNFIPEQAQYALSNTLDNSIDETLNQLKLKNLFSHLINIYNVGHKKETALEEVEKRRSDEWFQEKEILLRQALSSSHFWETKALDDFRLDIKDANFTKHGILYFQDDALFIGKYENYTFSYSFLNEESTFFRIVEHSYDLLQKYFKEGLSGSYTQKKLASRSLGNITITQLEQNVQDLLVSLQPDAKWLSDNNRDRVIRTFPKEASALLSLYTQASDPSTVEEHVASSFKNIIRTLKMMEYEAANNKQRAHLQQSHGVEAKD